MTGMLQRAIGGGAQAMQGMAQGYIEDERRTNLEQQLSNIAEQRQLRIDEVTRGRDFDSKKRDITELDPLRRQNTLDTDAALTRQKASLGVEVAPQVAQAQGILDEAKQDTERAGVVAQGQDPEYMSALKARERALALARHVETSDSVARAELTRMEIGDRKRLDTLYDQQAAVQNDTTLSDEDRQKKLRPIVTSIQAIKSKNSPMGQRDPELDTQTVTEEKINPDGSTTKTQRKEVRRPGQGAGGGAAPTGPAAGTVVNGFKFKGGDPNDKSNWMRVQPAAAAPAAPSVADQQMIDAAGKAGYTTGGKRYKGELLFQQGGKGEIITESQVRKQLGLSD